MTQSLRQILTVSCLPPPLGYAHPLHAFFALCGYFRDRFQSLSQQESTSSYRNAEKTIRQWARQNHMRLIVYPLASHAGAAGQLGGFPIHITDDMLSVACCIIPDLDQYFNIQRKLGKHPAQALQETEILILKHFRQSNSALAKNIDLRAQATGRRYINANGIDKHGYFLDISWRNYACRISATKSVFTHTMPLLLKLSLKNDFLLQ